MSSPSSRVEPRRRYRIETCDTDSPERTAAEQFVRDAFYRTHRAQIATFMPTLLLLKDDSGTLRAVAGCRMADAATLYLERYLAQPIETSIGERHGMRVRRADIVEIGNFASAGSRTARRFVSLLPYFLLQRGSTWVTFTATAAVRRILEHVGARCSELAAADGGCARDGADEWGRYYTHDPRVMAGYLPLARRIPALWNAAYAD